MQTYSEPKTETISTPPSPAFAHWIETTEQWLEALEAAAWWIRTQFDQASFDARQWWALAQRGIPIGTTVATIVYSYRFSRIADAFRTREAVARNQSKLHRKNGQRLARLARRQQGGLIKVGQILAGRDDLMPKEFVAPLKSLQSECEPMDSIAVQKMIDSCSFEQLKYVSTEPIAAASIAQIHRGIYESQPCAVKFWRPGIAKILEVDMIALRATLQALDTYIPSSAAEPLIDELQEQLMHETDPVREAENCRRMDHQIQQHNPNLARVPKVLAVSSQDQIAVFEFIEGQQIDQYIAQYKDTEPHRVEKIIESLCEAYVAQIIQFGWVQPDAHAGNFMVDSDDRLVMLDFGTCVDVSLQTRKLIQQAITAFIQHDDTLLAQTIAELGFRCQNGDFGPYITAIRSQIAAMMSQESAGSAVAWDKEELTKSVLAMMGEMNENPVTHVPADMFMIGRALLTVGGIVMGAQPKPALFVSLLAKILAPIEPSTALN